MSLFPAKNSFVVVKTSMSSYAKFDVWRQIFWLSESEILDFNDAGAFPFAKQTSSIVR